MTVELLKVSSLEDWDAYHRIRRTVLFEARGRFGIYDADHPDDRAAANHPLLLIEEERPRGTTRLDLLGERRAAIRLVAVEPGFQRRGLGRIMMSLAAQYAASLGVTLLQVNSAADAVEFYRRLGWTLTDRARENPLLELRL